MRMGISLTSALVFGSMGLVASLLAQGEPAGPPPSSPPAPVADAPPEPPRGVEVLARGPVHEAFASLTAEPVATRPVPKQPPRPIDEVPPAQKPEGDVVWIGGYWAWDDDRSDFLWVSGIWRAPPPGREWVAGYWREEGKEWQWVPGFWTSGVRAAAPGEEQGPSRQVTYLPQPPAPPEVAPPAQPPAQDTFFVPGAWAWNGTTYAWRAGYWARMQPGYVWVPDHYRWTPSGYVFIPGYWDYTVRRRGVLYAPVIIDPAVVRVGFTYAPAYAVSDGIVVDALFVRPAYCHYYFGDYYGPTYVDMGFQSCFVYSRRRYDSIVVYEAWEHRATPNWVGLQIDIVSGRSAGRLPCPPRTLVQQNVFIRERVTNVTVLASTSQVVAARGMKVTTLDGATRNQARLQAAAVQHVATQRVQVERPLPPGTPRQAHVASFSAVKAQPVKSGFTAPAAPKAAAPPALRPAGPMTTAGTTRAPGQGTVAPAHQPGAFGSAGPHPTPGRPGSSPGAMPYRPGQPGQRPAPNQGRPGQRPQDNHRSQHDHESPSR